MPASSARSSVDMQSIEHRMGTLDNKLDQVSLQLATLSAQIMPRAEVYAEDNKRVSLERFDGEMAGLRDRLMRLESGPQKVLAWIGIGTGCMSVIIAAMALLAVLVIALIPHLR